LKHKISFEKIPQIIHEAMTAHININRPSLEDILDSDTWAREYCRKKVE
jgi:1-deoxy-D-xylulose-5-phosphate reductoisomerase